MHRTLVLTLVQPIARTSIWRTRFRVGAGAMVVLAGLTASAIGLLDIVRSGSNDVLWLLYGLFIPLSLGVFVAPWLTFLCRSALAGTVFSSVLLLAVILISYRFNEWSRLRRTTTDSTSDGVMLFTFLFYGLCVYAHVAGRKRFLNLEAIESRGGTLKLVKRFPFGREKTSSRSRRSSHMLALIRKELRIQRMSWVPSIATPLCVWVLIGGPATGGGASEIFFALLGFAAVLTAVLIGALGSAEERQLGLIEWQALLPISSRTQWMTKAVTQIALALLLVVLLPFALVEAASGQAPVAYPNWVVGWAALAAVVLVSLSAWISSFCRTSIKAVLISVPVAALALPGLFAGYDACLRLFALARQQPGTLRNPTVYSPGILGYLTVAAPFAFTVALIVLLQIFACRNHFSAEKSSSRLLPQLGWILLLVAGAVISVLSLNLLQSIF